MQEELITIETAKLAKEKGFDEICAWVYYDPMKIIGKHHITGQVYTLRLGPCGARQYNYYKTPPKDGINRYHACTQALLQKWLRKNHGINVIPIPSEYEEDGEYHNCRIQSFKLKVNTEHCWGNTYEEALEVGLQEALKLIKIESL